METFPSGVPHEYQRNSTQMDGLAFCYWNDCIARGRLRKGRLNCQHVLNLLGCVFLFGLNMLRADYSLLERDDKLLRKWQLLVPLSEIWGHFRPTRCVSGWSLGLFKCLRCVPGVVSGIILKVKSNCVHGSTVREAPSEHTLRTCPA